MELALVVAIFVLGAVAGSLVTLAIVSDRLEPLTDGLQLTPSPAERLAAAQSQFTSQLAAAQGGDLRAVRNIPIYSDNLLRAAHEYYGESIGYQKIAKRVQAARAWSAQ